MGRSYREGGIVTDSRPTPADLVRQAASLARSLAETARLHHEPGEAARFEQIAAEALERARRLAELEAQYHP